MNEYEETWAYKICNLPPLPDELVEQVYELVSADTLNYLDYERTFTTPYTKDGEIKKSLALFQYETNKEINSWVYNNITRTGIANIRCSKSGGNGDGEKRDWKGPHTDSQRNYTLMYVLECGGADVQTVFYHESGETIVRDNALMPTNIDAMREIDRIKILPHTWVLLNSRILHSVDNISGTRISLQIGLSTFRGLRQYFIEN